MTKYLSKDPFSVGGGGNRAYADGWDRIFAKKAEPVDIHEPVFSHPDLDPNKPMPWDDFDLYWEEDL